MAWKDDEKTKYHCVCFYTTSKHESKANVLARNALEALQWAKKYFTTIALVIQRIEIYTDPKGDPIHIFNNQK